MRALGRWALGYVICCAGACSEHGDSAPPSAVWPDPAHAVPDGDGGPPPARLPDGGTAGHVQGAMLTPSGQTTAGPGRVGSAAEDPLVEPTGGQVAKPPCQNCPPAKSSGAADAAATQHSLCSVGPISDDLRQDYALDPFYTRYADAAGIPIIASDAPQAEALHRACLLVLDMSSAREDVRNLLLQGKVRFIMMGEDEKTVDTPDFGYLGDLDWRARGLGGIPAALCAEENILCNRSKDRWRGESICVHEFAHTMHMGGYAIADPTFDQRLQELHQASRTAGRFANTYADSKPAEYFAEAVQDWYNTNLEAPTADGIHNEINTRQELRAYDPQLYDLVAAFLPANPAYRDCYYYDQ